MVTGKHLNIECACSRGSLTISSQWQDEGLLRNWLSVIVWNLQRRCYVHAHLDNIKPQHRLIYQSSLVGGTIFYRSKGQGHDKCSLRKFVWGITSRDDMFRWKIRWLLFSVLILWKLKRLLRDGLSAWVWKMRCCFFELCCQLFDTRLIQLPQQLQL
jgi:hypothetical protein